MDQTHRSKEHYEHKTQGQAVVPLHQAQKNEHHERMPVGHEQDQSHQVALATHHDAGVTIFIDHKQYSVASAHVTGAQLRKLANPPIGADLDLFHAAAGKSVGDKIGDADAVDIDLHEVKHGRHFYSAKRALATPTDELARRAYFMYLNQGRRNGHDVEHWLAAERQIARHANS